MAPKFDESDFVDTEYQAAKAQSSVAPGQPGSVSNFLNRLPTREEIEAKVGETQQRLVELKRAQEHLERERTALEEARRRRVELQTGREEMSQNLTRGIGLLEKAESDARVNAEQMAKTISALREALTGVQAIHEETWNPEHWSVELTRALTTIENSRMEWNQARLKWPVLNAEASSPESQNKAGVSAGLFLGTKSVGQHWKLGFALNWPVALVGLLLLGALLILRFQ